MKQSGLSSDAFEVFDESFGTADSPCSSPGLGTSGIFTSTPIKSSGKMLEIVDPEIFMTSNGEPDIEVFDKSVDSHG